MGARERRRLARALTALLLGGTLAAAGPAGAGRSFIPIPEIITDPNEGTTLGLLAVVLFTDEQDEIRYMLAPDFRYNETTGFFPTLRFFGYPTHTRRYSIVAGKSTTRDENYEAQYADRGLWDGRAFMLASAEYEADSTERYFGIGNDSKEDRETNYTGVETLAKVTPGVYVLPHVHLSYRMRIRRYAVDQGQVDSVTSIFARPGEGHPNAPGLATGHYWAHMVAVTYDSRDEMDIPSEGTYAVAYTELADRRLGSSTSFVKFGAEWRRFTPLRRGNPILALRLLLDYTSGDSETPFWERSMLGGRRTLRAFGSQRFIDFNRSLASAELRTRVWSRRLFGVNFELELAPFAESGQVFQRVTDSPVSDLHWAGGLGFRGVVRPQIVGFVDVGYGSEGSAIFTGVDYPF